MMVTDRNSASHSSAKMKRFAITSLFVAIIFLMAFTPIGFLNLGIIKATIVHVPVIIGSILLGPKAGALLGFFFGLTSLINNTMAPALLSFAFSPLIPVYGADRGSFWALAICFIPRILVGVVPYYLDRILSYFGKNNKNWRFVSLFAAGVFGAMTNTLLVMNLIYLVFQNAYAAARAIEPGAVYPLILSVIAMHGVPEALVAGLFTSGVCKAIFAYRARSKPDDVGAENK